MYSDTGVHNRMSIVQGHVFGLNWSWRGPLNICLKVNHYKDTGILRLLMVSFQWCAPES